MMNSRHWMRMSFLPAASIMMIGGAHAQQVEPVGTVSTAPSDAQSPPDDAGAIVVTARRRAENLQRVPVAVTAISGETLKNIGALDSQDVSRLVPSLYVGQGGFGSSSSTIALRGINNPAANITFDPDIGIYVDDVYLARNYGTLFDYFDVSGVQVLRGVQGTLFGRNNVGGAVLISTTKPKNLNEMILSAEYGNYNAVKGSMVVNVAPVPDILALRLGFMSDTRDGYGHNIFNGQQLFNRNQQLVRFSALLTPSAKTEFQITGEYSQNDESGPPFTPRSPTGRVVTPGLGFYDGDYDTYWKDKGNNYYLTGHAKVDLGAVELKAIGNYLKGKNVVAQDVDATRTPPDLSNRRPTEHDQRSAEFQASGKLWNNRIDWIGGFYYQKEKGSQPTLTLAFNSESLLFIDNRTKAGFVHLDVKPIERLQIGGGVRYTQDDKGVQAGSHLTSTGVCTTPLVVQIPSAYDAASCLVSRVKDDSYWSYDANINYELADRIFVYARTGRGQKSGGFNSTLANLGDLAGYNPEIATDYEVGFKSELFDRRVKLNIALFQTKYDDIQRPATVVVTVGSAPTTAVTISNAAKAKIRGIELESSLHITPKLLLDANYSYIDPKYLSFTTVGAGGAIVDQSNFPFQQVSRHQGSVSLTYTTEVANEGRLNANVNYAYRSQYQNASILDPLTIQPGYGILNAQLRFEPRAFEGLEITAFVRNLTNEKYWTAGASAGTVRFVVAGQPRMYGAGLRYQFGD